MRRATISLWFDGDFDRGIRSVVAPHSTHFTGDISVLPSSLDAADPFAELVLRALPEATQAEVRVPVTGTAARRAFLSPMVLGSWTDKPIREQGAEVSSVTLPQQIVYANHTVIVTDVVEIARQGPFVLDLPARYIHPRQRMRLLASSQRQSLAAEIASAMTPSLCVVCFAQKDGLSAAGTTDPIAAELAALALSELCHGAPRGFSGPWEDPVVQRATELELGVGLPQHILLVPDGPERNSHWAQRVIEHLRLRLGIPGVVK